MAETNPILSIVSFFKNPQKDFNKSPKKSLKYQRFTTIRLERYKELDS